MKRGISEQCAFKFSSLFPRFLQISFPAPGSNSAHLFLAVSQTPLGTFCRQFRSSASGDSELKYKRGHVFCRVDQEGTHGAHSVDPRILSSLDRPNHPV